MVINHGTLLMMNNINKINKGCLVKLFLKIFRFKTKYISNDKNSFLLNIIK